MKQDNHSSENDEINKPDFVYVETENYESGQEFGGFQREFKHSYQEMGGKSYPISVRIVCFICALFISFFLLLATPFLLLFLGVNLLTFFQWSAFLERTKQVWNAYSKMFITALGLLIAVISPAFGLSVIMIYFMMRGQNSDGVWVNRILKARFKNQ